MTEEALREPVLVLNQFWTGKYPRLTKALGQPPQQTPYLTNCLNPDQRQSRLNLWTMGRVLDISPHQVRFDFLTKLIERWGLVPVELPPAPEIINLAHFFEANAEISREVGDVARQSLEMLRDGKISKAEAAASHQEILAAVAALLRLDQMVQLKAN